MNVYVRSIWKTYDQDGNGVLDRDEAKQFMREMMSEIVMIQPKDDYDDDGTTPAQNEFDEDGFSQIFTTLDADNSGTISQDEMVDYLKNICGAQISL